MAGTPQVIEGLEDHLPFQQQKSCIFLMPCVFRLYIYVYEKSYIVAHKFGYLFKHGFSLPPTQIVGPTIGSGRNVEVPLQVTDCRYLVVPRVKTCVIFVDLCNL